MPEWLIPVLTAFGGGAGLAAAYRVLRTIGVQKVDIAVTGLGKVVSGQDTFIETLREEVAADRERVAALGRAVDTLRGDLRQVTEERDQLRRENRSLRERITHLEQRVEDLVHVKESRGERRDREDAEPAE